MSTTTIKFSPSINILRDSDYSFNYIATPNATKVFDRILSDALAGSKCNLIIGAYGTGKSSFLLAFKQTLEGSKIHFSGKDKLIGATAKYEFIQLIGDNKSLSEHCAKMFDVKKSDF